MIIDAGGCHQPQHMRGPMQLTTKIAQANICNLHASDEKTAQDEQYVVMASPVELPVRWFSYSLAGQKRLLLTLQPLERLNHAVLSRGLFRTTSIANFTSFLLSSLA